MYKGVSSVFFVVYNMMTLDALRLLTGTDSLIGVSATQYCCLLPSVAMLAIVGISLLHKAH